MKVRVNRVTATFLLLMLILPVAAQRKATYVVYFAPNSSVPSAADEFRLESFIFPSDSFYVKAIDIHGYTDDVGNKKYNDSLSSRRAQQIRNLLIELGVKAGRIIQTKGKGEKPVGIGLNAEQQRALNRRVEVVFYYDLKKFENALYSRVDTGTAPVQKNKPDTVFIVKRDTVVIVKRDTVFLIHHNGEIRPLRREEKEVAENNKSRLIPDSIKVGDKIILPNILFEGGTRRMLRESYATLDQLALILNQRPDIKIRILGHICCQKKGKDGTDDETGKKNLSVVRAKAVYEYLISKGIEKQRLQYKGMKANFKTGKGAAFDRRVEIEIVEVRGKKVR